MVIDASVRALVVEHKGGGVGRIVLDEDDTMPVHYIVLIA